jgi:hypothetical protein
MKHWYNRGAFGESIFELSWLDLLLLCIGRELVRSGVVICLGKSRLKCHSNVSREDQVKNQ